MIKIYTDASTKGNPGPTGIGIVIVTDNEHIQLSIPLLNDYTNHQAEFIAQIIALEYVEQHYDCDQMLFLYTDSRITVQSIEKRYAKEFQFYVDDITPYFEQHPLWFIKWIPEKKNQGADHLARQALHQCSKHKIHPLNVHHY